jgi:hypothetical protein
MQETQTNTFTPDTLIIELSEDALSYCEYHHESNTPISIQNYPIDRNNISLIENEFVRFFNNSNLLLKQYSNVYINYSHSKFTLCPFILFSAENARDLLEFNTGNTNESIIKYDFINHDIVCLYSIPESINSSIDKLLPNHKTKHTLSVLCELFLNSEEFKNESVLLVINSSSIDLIIKNKQKLLIANSFNVNSHEDILYYLLFSLEQFELNPLTARLSIAGNIETNNTLALAIKKYIKEVRFASGHKSINWSNLNGIPQHQYYSILNRIFCAS